MIFLMNIYGRSWTGMCVAAKIYFYVNMNLHQRIGTKIHVCRNKEFCYNCNIFLHTEEGIL